MKDIEKLSLKEKIGQKFIIGFDENLNVLEKIEETIKNYKIGGVLIYKKNYKNYDELINLINNIRRINKKYSQVPIIISIDQEGGRVNRIPNDFLNMPSSYNLAKTGGMELVAEAAEITGDILKNLGINMDFAPVLDIKRFQEKHVIGDRAYSDDIEMVSKCGIEFIKKLKEKGIIAVMKHFPGHGATKIDSHFILPIIFKRLEELEKNDMKPFKEAMAYGTDAMLIGHLVIPRVTKLYPASMSKKVINYIRQELNFNGIIITDDMRMKSVRLLYGKDRAIKRAFKVGNDLIMVKYSKDDRVFKKIEKAVVRKKISEEKLDESVKKILDLKSKYNVNDDLKIEKMDVEKYNEKILRIKNLCID